MKTADLIIIGGGAAGLSAAITAARNGQHVALLEHNNRLGKKLLASGNGRCNLSNAAITPHRFHSDHPPFVDAVLDGYGTEKVRAFFGSIGLEIVEGKEGQLFPMSLQATSVVEMLEFAAREAGVEIILECTVEAITHEEHFTVTGTQETFTAPRLLLAAGSAAASRLGGSESGYEFALSLGHTLIPIHPALVQLRSEVPWLKTCSGVKISGTATLYANGEYITEKQGDLLFTDYGISGLAILDLSRQVSTRLADYAHCELRLDLLPDYPKEKLTALLLKRIAPQSRKPLLLWLEGILHKKLARALLSHTRCRARIEAELNRKSVNTLVHAIKNLPLPIHDTRGFESAEVAAGGIDTREINPVTMESRIVPGLYLAGEILDVDGDRGGFNLHFAWVSGMRAAQAASSE